MSNGKQTAIGTTWSQGIRVLMVGAFAALALLVVTSDTPRAAGTFAPTVTFETSTTKAAAHPDARITIDNSASDEDIENITIDLPDGFWGSLNAANQCTQVNVDADTCDPDTEIGTVINDAKVDDSDVRLRGKIYLTEPEAAYVNDDPAGIAIIVPAVVGGVDLGRVTVKARVSVRSEDLGPSAATGVVGAIRGMRTIVTGVPKTIGPNADTDGRTLSFHIKKLIVDLKSDQTGGFSPLLTNPSDCSAASTVTATMESYDGTNAAPSDSYQATGCTETPFEVGTFDLSMTNPAAGETSGLVANIDFPEGGSTLRSIFVAMPPMVQTNLPSFGEIADQCSAGSVTSNKYFNPALCPAPISPATKSPAVIGRATIETQLLPDPVVGDVYLVNRSPIPWLAIDVSPESHPSNPKGVTIRMVGQTATPMLDPECDTLAPPVEYCPTQVSAFFNNLPDAPVSAVQMDLDLPDREGSLGTLSSDPLSLASSADPFCQPTDDFSGRFISTARPALADARFDVSSQNFTGCDPRDVSFISSPTSPVGQVTTNADPAFEFTDVSGSINCAIDVFHQGISEPCTSPYEPPTVSAGSHRVYAAGTTVESRVFVVEDPPPTPDTTAPTVTIDSGPTGNAVTSDTTPTWDFSSNDPASEFECSIDDGSFLPCDSSASPASSGSFTVPTTGPDVFYAGTTHTFAVRAQDAAGNVSPAVQADFGVEIDFAPSLGTILSTTQARAHPDLDLTVQSSSAEDLKSVKLGLPSGFFGGLTGVQSLCPLATAAAGNCTVASQVGTVDAEARVDESIVRISGQVYLTDSEHAGEPAGISIKVPAVIQEVDLGNIIVAGRLQVRGQAEGIDSLVVDIPDRIVPTNGFDTETEFDMRKITLKLRTGQGASYPLLTNPSSCNGSAFVATFTGYAATATADSNAFAATGCEALGFGPQLAMSVTDSTTGQPPMNSTSAKPISANLSATLAANPGDAGIRDVSILMPRPLTINLLRIPPACTIAEYADGAGQCPETSRVGTVSAISPLLPEALTGSVYLLKQPTTEVVTPRLLLALRGRINIDIIANNRFENQTQIRTTFSGLPDVPLSSFTLNVAGVLSTRNEACEVPADEWNAIGQLAAFNGKTSPVNVPLVFGCKPKYSFKYRKRGKKTSLNVTTVGGPVKLRKVVIRLPRSVKPIRRRLKRKLVVRADGKKLSRRCYRVSRRSVTVKLCGKKASVINVSFRSGSLVAGRKASKRVKRLSLYGVSESRKRVRFGR